MLGRFWRSPRIEVEVAVPIGCLVPLVAMLAAVLGLVRR
jgi:hypothetical protein